MILEFEKLPISFNAEMVRQIRAGRKTQTRRLHERPRYSIGDILYVREPWNHTDWMLLNAGISARIPYTEHQFIYKADNTDLSSLQEYYESDIKKLHEISFDRWFWSPPNIMREEAARFYLKVTRVWTESLQDIGLDGIEKEGFDSELEFISMWDEIYWDDGERWEDDPPVWVYEFEAFELTINQSKNKKTMFLKSLQKYNSKAPTLSTEELKLEIAHREQTDMPRFPLEVFPDAIKPMIEFMVTDMGIPECFTGTAILSAIATAIGSSVYVKHNTFKEKMNLYTVLVGETSMGKGEAWKYASAPLMKWQKQMQAQAQQETEQSKEESKNEPGTYWKPSQKTVLIKDFNYASLIEVIKQNPRGVCGVFDEFSAFFKKAGKRGNEELLDEVTTWWNSFTGHQKNLYTRVDIIPGETFCLNIHGGTQPKFVKHWMGDNFDSGLFHRFLFAFHPGFEYGEKDLDAVLSENISAPYYKLIDDIYNTFKIFQHGHLGKAITLTPKAHAVFKQFNHFSKKWRSEDGLEHDHRNLRAGIVGKQLQYVLRLAGILQLCENLTDGFDPLEPVSDDTMHKAQKLSKYFMASGEQAALSSMNSSFVPFDVMYFAMTLRKHNYNLTKAGEDMNLHRNTVKKYYNQYKKQYKKLFQQG